MWDSNPRAAPEARFQSNVLTTRLTVGILTGNQNWSKLHRSGDVQPEIKLPWPNLHHTQPHSLHCLVLGGLVVLSGQGQIVFDVLVSCGPYGLPSYLLLSFSPDILTGALGVAAIAFISRIVLVATDEGAVVLQLQAWSNQPPPATKEWMLGPGLVQWSRTLVQLVACDCAPSLAAQRLSLYHLVSCVQDTGANLRAGCVASCVQRSRGRRHQGPHRHRTIEGRGVQLREASTASRGDDVLCGVADEVESKITCPWGRGHLPLGRSLQMAHEGPAGIAVVAKRHRPREEKTNKKSSVNVAHELKAPETSRRYCHKS